MKNNEYEYEISFSKSGLIIPVIGSAVFIAASIFFFKLTPFAGIFTSVLAVICTSATLYSIYATLFIKIYIGENSFTHEKGPGISKTYHYSDVTEAWISSGQATNGSNTHYFNYKTKDGKVHKFLFYAYQYEETEYLLAKINGEEATEDE